MGLKANGLNGLALGAWGAVQATCARRRGGARRRDARHRLAAWPRRAGSAGAAEPGHRLQLRLPHRDVICMFATLMAIGPLVRRHAAANRQPAPHRSAWPNFPAEAAPSRRHPWEPVPSPSTSTSRSSAVRVLDLLCRPDLLPRAREQPRGLSDGIRAPACPCRLAGIPAPKTYKLQTDVAATTTATPGPAASADAERGRRRSARRWSRLRRDGPTARPASMPTVPSRRRRTACQDRAAAIAAARRSSSGCASDTDPRGLHGRRRRRRGRRHRRRPTVRGVDRSRRRCSATSRQCRTHDCGERAARAAADELLRAGHAAPGRRGARSWADACSPRCRPTRHPDQVTLARRRTDHGLLRGSTRRRPAWRPC